MSNLDSVKYDSASKEVADEMKLLCEKVTDTIVKYMGNTRARSIALTKIDECYMWVGRAIRDDQIIREEKD